MIDEKLFKKILDTEENGYIENGDNIPYSIIKLFSNYSSEKTKKLFIKNPNNFTINKFNCELKCKKCGNMFYKELSKTALLDYCKKDGLGICNECLKKEKEDESREKKEASINREKILRENTNIYIRSFLDPNKSWKNGVKTYEKINDILRDFVDWGEIKDYITSMDYKDFLSTPYWKAISEKVRKKSGFRCQLCNSNKNLNVHHRTYENHGDEIHHMGDLICLCKECHEKYHFD